jgi:hypothetical protein
MGIDGTQALQITQNVDAGYEETLCVMCRNLAGSTISHDNYKIEQTRNCATALVGQVQSPVHAPVTIEYTDATTLHVAATASVQFFTNPHATLCGAINSCKLKQQGCGADYTIGNLVINAVTGEVTIKKDVDAGYVDIVCVSCQNSHASIIEFDNWTVTQKPNCNTLTA